MILSWLPVAIALTGQAAPPPPVQVTRPATVVAPAAAQTPRPVPKTYNETADGQTVINTAVHAADTDDIRALIIWGANDNVQCTAFETARRAVPGMFFSDEYKVGYVDIGKLDKNLDLAKKYGATLSAESLPALTVLDQKGKVLANISGRDLAAADGGGFDSKKLTDFLARNQAPAPDAIAPFEAAVKQAKTEGKTVFVWFSAPW